MKIIITLIIIILSTFSLANSQESPLLKTLNAIPSLVFIQAIQTKSANPNKPSPTDKKSLSNRQSPLKLNINQGAGIILSSDGLIVTNLHTIQHAQKIIVKLANGTQTFAQIINIQPNSDLALLKIKTPSKLKPVIFSNSNQVKLHDPVLHIGASQLLNQTVSQGQITGIGTSKTQTTNPKDIQILQINLNIHHGDSGGPIFNTKGELIGIISAKNLKQQRRAFAIPSNKIKKLYLNAQH